MEIVFNKFTSKKKLQIQIYVTDPYSYHNIGMIKHALKHFFLIVQIIQSGALHLIKSFGTGKKLLFAKNSFFKCEGRLNRTVYFSNTYLS